ncbi:uncharacterized protein BJ171DRAFT_493767 [Polychytrium aggregatum]|uniref:uncharacterized protein n=1 Tax=Polychytrium aggregatum TaxID=110093 RepID=UPI0022FEAC80|nr:uncharacterized protein BJ171DRAFT_493767 [Polychytrium aggregatum]KAI9207141.1 hypothetical protein BJ171DRAFT_493767 [Polychytrium aggregatum]
MLLGRLDGLPLVSFGPGECCCAALACLQQEYLSLVTLVSFSLTLFVPTFSRLPGPPAPPSAHTSTFCVSDTRGLATSMLCFLPPSLYYGCVTALFLNDRCAHHHRRPPAAAAAHAGSPAARPVLWRNRRIAS